MRAACDRAMAEQFDAVAFGDLFLEDVRDYRLRQLAGISLEPLFPVWKIPTAQLALEMLAQGVKAKLTCIDPSKLDRSFAGREYDSELLADLPKEVDPCGENVEFHTFVYDSPVFLSPIPVKMGEIVERDNFVFADVMPV
jgi:diphthamide synthase (EF-2-diphthine--ammonia ligase)